MKKNFFIITMLVFFASFVFAGAPTVTVIQPTYGNYFKNGFVDINFTVMDSDSPSEMKAFIYYDVIQGGQSNTIIDNLNLFGIDVCEDNDFTDVTNCWYRWNMNISTDGNYYIDVNVADLTYNDDANADSGSFYVDNTPPITSWDGNESWMNSDQTITLTCNDNGADCDSSSPQFNLDSNGFQKYENPILISEEGQHSLEFYSVDNANNEESHQTKTVGIDKNSPTKVSGLSVSAGHQQVSLSWTASTDSVSGVMEYRVYRSDVNAFDVNILAGATSNTNYTDSSLINGQTYYYRVIASDHAGNDSNQSDIVSGTPNDTSKPSTSWNGSESWRNSDLSVSLTCNDGSSGSGCKTVYWKIGGGSWNSINGSTVNFTVNSEGEQTIEFYSVDDANNEEVHQTKTVRIDKTQPNSISLSASANNNGEVDLSWNSFSDNSPSSGLREVQVWRKESSGSYSNIHTTSSSITSYTSSGLGNGTTYYFKVKYIDNAGNERESNERSATPTNKCSASVTLTAPSYVSDGTFTAKISSDERLHDGTFSFCASWKAGCTEYSGLSGSTISKNFTVSSGDRGSITVEFSGYDEDGKECLREKDVVVDAVEPEIEWLSPEEGAVIEDYNISLTVKISDKGSSIATLYFYERAKGQTEWELITSVSNPRLDEMTRYCDMSEHAEGEYELKSVLEDRAGNKSEEIITIMLGSEIVEEEPKKEPIVLEEEDTAPKTLSEENNDLETTAPVTGLITGEIVDLGAKALGAIIVIAVILAVVLIVKGRMGDGKGEVVYSGIPSSENKGRGFSFPKIIGKKNEPEERKPKWSYEG
ncbi:MAG: fibronectin type III domain-containing protein [archaeon]